MNNNTFKVTKKAKFWWKSKDWRKSIFSHKQKLFECLWIDQTFFSLRDFVHLGYCDPWRRRCSSFVGVTNYVTTQNLRIMEEPTLFYFESCVWLKRSTERKILLKKVWQKGMKSPKRYERICNRKPIQTIYIIVSFK